MPFGPSQEEALLLFKLPFIISILLVVCLLFNWRRVLALLVAAVTFAIYVAIGFSALKSLLGAMMLLFSGWVAVMFLAIALFVSTRRSNKNV